MINAIFLTRSSCGPSGDQNNCRPSCGSFTIQLLILLTSIATMVYKAMHLRGFPAVWHEHEQLLVEKCQLADRFSELTNAIAEPSANSAAARSSDIANDTASESGLGDAKRGAAAAAQSFGGGAGVAVAKVATAMPPLHPTMRSGIGNAGTPRMVAHEVTFEIGMLPECGR